MGKRGRLVKKRRNHDDGIQDAVASGAVVQLVADWDLGVLRGVRSDEDHEIAWALTPARARQVAASLLRAANTCEPPTSTADAIQRANVQQHVEDLAHVHAWSSDGGVVHCPCGALTPDGAIRQTPDAAPQARDGVGQRAPLPAMVVAFGDDGAGVADDNRHVVAHGHVVGYCCPSCLHFHSACLRVGVYGEWPDEEHDLSFAREQADRCCRCHYCDGPLTRADRQRDEDYDAPSLRATHCCATCYEPEHEKALVWAARCNAASAAQQVVYEQALALALDRDAALRLYECMSTISETYYCAGWLTDLEFSLWAMVQGGSRAFGLGEVTVAEVAELRRLHERAGGWWAYFEGGPEHDSERGNLGGGEQFVPTAAWLDMALSVPR